MGGGVLTKKMAGYHQFHAVNFAVEETLRAAVGRRTSEAFADTSLAAAWRRAR